MGQFSKTMKKETLEEYLKRGGLINKITEYRDQKDLSFFTSAKIQQEAFKKAADKRKFLYKNKGEVK